MLNQLSHPGTPRKTIFKNISHDETNEEIFSIDNVLLNVKFPKIS